MKARQLPGTVHIELYSRDADTDDGRIERLLSQLAAAGVVLRRMRVEQAGRVALQLQVADVRRLRHVSRGSGVGWRIVRRRGIAFAPVWLLRHSFFLTGAALFLGMLLTLQALVLEVDVVAPASVGAAHVREIAALEGVHRGQWKASLPAPDQLAERLAQRMPEAAWVGVRFLGTHCEIRVVGRTLREPIARPAPRHIVATHDAVVTAIHADKGMPMVRPNDHVLRGQILISGLVGDETHNRRVAATGTVRGPVWYTQSIAVPITTRTRALTRRQPDQRFIRIFGYTVKYKGFRQSSLQRPLIHRTAHHPTVFGRRMPWTFIRQRKWEVDTAVTTVTRQQARITALRQGAQQLLRELGKDAVLTRQNLLHETVRGGKVYINIHVEVDQAIAKETDLIDRPTDR